jgi:hypothetical protein
MVPKGRAIADALALPSCLPSCPAVALLHPLVTRPEAATVCLCREADLLAMLEHPNLVELKDVIRSPRQLVMVLEWLR